MKKMSQFCKCTLAWVAIALILQSLVKGEINGNKSEMERQLGLLVPLLRAIDDDSVASESEAVNLLLRGLVEESPDAANKMLNVFRNRSSRFMELLKGLKIDFKTLHGSDVLGIGYEYNRDISKRYFLNDVNKFGGVGLVIDTSGDVAMDSNDNPNDFIEGKLAFSVFYSLGGVSVLSTDEQAEFNNELALKLADIEEMHIEEFERLSEFRDLVGGIRNNLSDQFYVDLKVDGGIESDQSFEVVRHSFGMHASVLAKGWGSGSALGRYNVLDYPGALVRYLFGYGDWQPRGTAFPEFLVGVDRIDPTDEDDPRVLAGDDSDYSRFRFTASFRSEVGKLFGDRIFVEGTYRYFSEFDPEEVIEDVGLSSSTYYTLSLLLPGNYFVSYAHGRLPFDEIDESVYQLGLKYNF
ncbi:hypothetical protein [Pelagicoccus sp. SDUM812005]|uniref:hypothetical protein n=1 Tax=Pelagicoccus sp. SDUM812005 TaxID=3041257 RepID=UPI00280E4432|nr:hypothetical protein [Pelagicoccus sp. SDUM812005]MDQ8182592.1 hypothetical protein [Pelagicoccus sp. SDUM812005]